MKMRCGHRRTVGLKAVIDLIVSYTDTSKKQHDT
jgi:hypothetical protein